VAAGALRSSHSLSLEGLEEGRIESFRIEAVDRAGNRNTTPVPPECFQVLPTADCILRSEFGPEDPSAWSHGVIVGPDAWTLAEDALARSPPWSFQGGNPGVLQESYLVSPPFDVDPEAVFGFWHAYGLEDGFDGAFLEITTDEGATWTDLGPWILEGTYTGSFTHAEGSETRQGWTGFREDTLQPVRVALETFAGAGRRIRFRLSCDDSVGSPGWTIDDVSICTFAADPGIPSFTRGNCSVDGLVNLSDAIFLFNYLFLGGSEPSCHAACDMDGNAALNITDGIYLLDYLFQGGKPLPPPTSCGALLDPGLLECRSQACAE
jgi:hypothetical protein